jgi:hypothetical protein
LTNTNIYRGTTIGIKEHVLSSIGMKWRINGTLKWFTIVALLLFLAGCAGDPGKRPPSTLDQAASSQWEAQGIKVEFIRVTAGGRFLDMRYRVTDPAKAGQVLKRDTRLELTDQATGTVLAVPNMAKVGKLRQLPGKKEDSRIYWAFFDNHGGLVKPGGKVALTIGALRISDISVE